MQLTREENEMLEGKYGYAVQKSMEIMVGLGECYDANRMIPIASAHLVAGFKMGKAGALLCEEMARKGGKFKAFTDTNPLGIDPLLWQDLGFPEEFARKWLKLINTCAEMGMFLSNTCTPYLVGHFPRSGEHIAWSESSAVVFANSVLGARTNREGGPSSLAAAFCGRVPEYGFHLDQNRLGDLEIRVTADLKELNDFGALGYFTGKLAEDRVPVFTGITAPISVDQLKHLGAGTATSGSVALFHIVGITPEAPDREAAFGGRELKDGQIFEFSEKDLKETRESLCRPTERQINLVILGCPHASIGEIKDISRILEGKKLKPSVELWVLTSRIVKDYADRMGYKEIIESAGGKILSEFCPLLAPNGYLKNRGHRIAATNSVKMCRIAFMDFDVNIPSYLGSTEDCIEAAVSGAWR